MPILINRQTKVGFPTHEQINDSLLRLGRADEYERYASSAVGKGTRLKGKHLYGVEHSVNGTVVLGGDSVARGWLANPEVWERKFSPEYHDRSIHRKVFLQTSTEWDEDDSYLLNSALLWDGSAGTSLPIELEDALRFTFTSTGAQGGFDGWIRCATSARITPMDVVRAAKRVSAIKGIHSEPMFFLSSIVRQAELKSGVELDREDYVAWMFVASMIREEAKEQSVDIPSLMSSVVEAGIKPDDFARRFRAGIPLSGIPASAANGVDIDLMVSLANTPR